MGDDLGDEWWNNDNNSDASEAEEEDVQQKRPDEKTKIKPEKRKQPAQKTVKAKKKKSSEQKDLVNAQRAETENAQSSEPKKKRRRKKKTIEDVLASSEPKPGRPADLQELITGYFSDKRSVIELEELRVHDSCFLSSNDLSHSLSSYLKQVCPKWAKIQKQHTEKSSVVVLIICSSALRAIELIKQLTAFKGEAKAVKLFAKHIKVEEQVKLLQKGTAHIGVGTPGRISALIEKDGLNLRALRYLVLDWNWRDQKHRRMVDIPEIKLDFLKLLDSGILSACNQDKVKIGLF